MAAAHSEAFLTTVASTLRDVTCDVFRLCGKNVYNYDVELLGCVSDRVTFRVHSVRGRGITGRERERTEQEQYYAVILMVCAAVCSGLVDLAPSGSVLVVLRLRVPSVEPTLEAE